MATIDNITRIEDRIDKTAAGATAINMDLGGVQFKSMIEIMEFSKLMAVAGAAVPVHLRGNPGACLAICTRALRFGFDPFALAEHSYSMKKSQKVGNNWEDVETIAYDSFVISAIINAHAPITGRIDFTYSGEGDERKCKAFAMPRGASKPLEHESPTIGALKAGRARNDKGQIKGSPLWEGPKSDQQLAYDTRRDFCRKFYPEVLLGWYDKDELEEYGGRTIEAEAVPSVASRLKGGKGARGFSEEGVAKALENKPGQTLDAGQHKQPEPVLAAKPAIVEEAKELPLTGDAETEIASKKRAVENVETKADLTAIVQQATDYLKGVNRTDLLGDFLSVASAREKKLKA